MARQPINRGTAAGDGTGDSLFAAFTKVNANETELYASKTETAATSAGFPVTGETTKIYIALDTGVTYRWTGSVYQALALAPSFDLSGALSGLVGPDGTVYPMPIEPVDDIGVAGRQGFGVGICPTLPSGYAPLAGYTDPASDNYGNYQYSDGSVMVWVPAFYYRIGAVDSPNYATYAGNAIDIAGYSAFADVATANANGYALHRAFYDGGAIQAGFFVDKYEASNNGGVASSIKNGNPLSTNSAHNPIGSLTGLVAGDNIYGGVFKAAKTRGTAFFPLMRYQFAALALLATAHGQAATTTSWCAWYDPALVKNFVKGNNNNALKDGNDTTVVYVSDGYPNCGKTGSATPFSKTTHNGQASGIADLNGNMWEVSPGLTCVSGTVNITAATQANPVAITAAGHGRATGDIVQIGSVVGMTQINDKLFAVTVVDANNFTLNGVDGTAFTAYSSGGTVTYGTFYALSTAYAAKNLTGGNTLATDQFGAIGVAAHSVALPMTFRTDYSQNGFDKRFGRSANAVLDAATSGDGWARTALGLPLAGGISDGASGSNLFGIDQFYQYVRNELCPIAGENWNTSSAAGVWAVHCSYYRGYSSVTVGFRCASFL
ncbi:MAG: ubiquitin-activating E1 FCCH domain-containing protein [Thiobacillus sp.]|uniref:ubiquitin-activating E1 FCCH domain-containing protein n=1 Tax=Thiobacillus sp. TaxID=924 RepID=UPI002895B071|nr:ubiquitin-activating E1 FCCH domain-containing protein [Thiobacillus sp.]MDT3708165.1 ubiquitin-activating E1 FCCH domain-containing protein [Thiobacillus sp.]